jgi:hypothetical protein
VQVRNHYRFQRIAASRGTHLMTALGRGKRCRSAVLRSRGLSSHRSPSIEGGSANHASLGRVEVFLRSTISIVKKTWSSPVNGGDGEVSSRTVEKPLRKSEKQEFWMPESSIQPLHIIVWFSV